ncbi:MAG: diguanylate cyclase [Xanthomonadaceae bacterium]|nr:diguanylate cyclase [Xanthomonadaceae bacterium]
MAGLATAQGPPKIIQDVQLLIERAARMDVTRPPRETLAYLDSIQDALADATLQQRVQLRIIRARSHVLMTEYDTALAILEDLLANDLVPVQRLRALELAANLALHIDQFEEGFDYLNRAMILQEEVDDPALKSGVFGLATYWHTQMGDQQKGLEYAQRTMQLAQASGDTRELCVALEKLGQAEEMMGLHERALERYQAGLEACEEAQDPVFTGVMYGLMGRLLTRLERHAEAEPWLEKGIELTTASGFQDGATDTMTKYAELLVALERDDEARVLLQQVLDKTRSGGRPQNRADAHRMLAHISHRADDYRSAWNYITEYLQDREGVLDVERARIIAFQEVQFDLHSREQEIQLLREQTRVSDLQETTRRQQRLIQLIAFGLVALILVLLLALLFRTRRERRHFRHMSAHDGLTGMLNHSHFIDTAKQQSREAGEHGKNVILVLADIDHFKQFNDRHGHQAGDEVLRKTASRFKGILSQYGLVGRVGGEEFAACLFGLDIDRATRIVDQVREALQSCRLSDVEDPVTMSFGIAQLSPSDHFESLRARADAALYRAKHDGRDRLVVAGAPASAAT